MDGDLHLRGNHAQFKGEKQTRTGKLRTPKSKTHRLPPKVAPPAANGYNSAMLTIRCATCRTKLWKYNKLGKGEVLRCHKARIARMLEARERDGAIYCPCGQRIGLDKGSYWKMLKNAFSSSGLKVSKL